MSQTDSRRAKRKRLWQLGYILFTVLVLVLLGILNPEIAPLFQGALRLDVAWVWLCACSVLAFWLVQTFVYDINARVVGARIPLHRSMKVMLFGEYYSAVTPFASGGQPMQLGYYKRYGVSAAKGTSILALRYIGYMTALCLCFLAAFAAQGRQIHAEHPVVFYMTTFGFSVNLASVIGVVMLMLRRSLVDKTGAWCIRIICRLPWYRHRRASFSERFARGADEFASALLCVRKKPGMCMLGILLSLLSVICQFSIAYFVYRSVGLREAGFFPLFSMQIFLYLAVAFVPTPGAAGASEGGFYLFFAMLFPKPLLFSAMLLWRLFTYYISLFAGAVLVLLDEVRVMSRQARKAE